ncbi:MAG: hypothetical protein K8R46_09305 [Pirellulales bacterium]|nr:hypothetical protein [Pirellulales bacterium]
MMKRTLPIVALVFCLSGTLFAQAPIPPYLGHPDDLSARLNQLEAETQTLRAEVEWLREHPVRLPSVDAQPAGMSSMMVAPEDDGGEYFTLEELRTEMKKQAWTKGDFKIVPYGILWGNMVYSTQRTTPGSYTVFVHSASTSNEDEFIVDARNTRLGIDISGPRIPFFFCAPSGGKLEVDFQNSLISTENRATIMLRHAYLETKNEEFRFLFGQTWDVISPLYPGMLMYSVAWDAGNIGYRRAQIRGERYLAFSDVSLLTVQLSANQQVFEDDNVNNNGEFPNWPIIEGRVGWTLGQRGKYSLPITVGASAHVGEEQFDHAIVGRNIQRRTWSANLDLRIPINERMGFQGEWFAGENLGAFLGGIGQGINPITLNPIRSTGGWFEFWFDWTPYLHSHVGHSVDDPNNNDVAAGQRNFNQCYFGNLSYDFTDKFMMGFEVSSWQTLYADRLPGDAVRCEFVAKYGF